MSNKQQCINKKAVAGVHITVAGLRQIWSCFWRNLLETGIHCELWFTIHESSFSLLKQNSWPRGPRNLSRILVRTKRFGSCPEFLSVVSVLVIVKFFIKRFLGLGPMTDWMSGSLWLWTTIYGPFMEKQFSKASCCILTYFPGITLKYFFII